MDYSGMGKENPETLQVNAISSGGEEGARAHKVAMK